MHAGAAPTTGSSGTLYWSGSFVLNMTVICVSSAALAAAIATVQWWRQSLGTACKSSPSERLVDCWGLLAILSTLYDRRELRQMPFSSCLATEDASKGTAFWGEEEDREGVLSAMELTFCGIHMFEGGSIH